MNDRTKVMHLPPGALPPKATYHSDAAKKFRRRVGWIIFLATFNTIIWPVVFVYWIIRWEDIFR